MWVHRMSKTEESISPRAPYHFLYPTGVGREGLSMGKAQATGGGELFASNYFYPPFFLKAQLHRVLI